MDILRKTTFCKYLKIKNTHLWLLACLRLPCLPSLKREILIFIWSLEIRTNHTEAKKCSFRLKNSRLFATKILFSDNIVCSPKPLPAPAPPESGSSRVSSNCLGPCISSGIRERRICTVSAGEGRLVSGDIFIRHIIFPSLLQTCILAIHHNPSATHGRNPKLEGKKHYPILCSGFESD